MILADGDWEHVPAPIQGGLAVVAFAVLIVLIAYLISHK